MAVEWKKVAFCADKIDKATNVTAITDTGIADGEIAVFNLSNKDIRTSNVLISTDGTLAGNADTNVPTEKAVKTYADATMATSTAEVDLRYFMDQYYGAGVWTQRTGVGTGSDIAPALALALDYLRSEYGRGIVRIPPGVWLMNSGVTATKLNGNYLVGYGTAASRIVCNFSTGYAFPFTGASGYSGGGLKALSIFLENGLGKTNTYAIRLKGDDTYQPSATTFQDINITVVDSGSDSYWYCGFFADGSLKTSPQGIRHNTLSFFRIFRCHYYGAYFKNCVQWTVDNFGIMVGDGTGNNLYIAGVTGEATQSTVGFSLTRATISGELNLTNCSKIHVDGGNCTTYNRDATATYSYVSLIATTVAGTPSGTIREVINGAPAGNKYYTGTRDMTADTGDVAYTTIGFKPSSLIILASCAALACTTIYIYGSGGDGALYLSGGAWRPYSIGYLLESAGKSQTFAVKSLDADGFTLTWTKTGTVSAGTATFYALCFR